jgi:hypothetical protein
MNNVDEQCFFFFVIRTVRIFLDQTGSRVKYKHIDRLIVITIKIHALIPNLMQDDN